MNRELIEQKAKEILDSKETRIWADFLRALSLVSEKIFARSSHFLLELIQNAEDVHTGIKDMYLKTMSPSSLRCEAGNRAF